jgi:hypothetical protein
MSREGSTEKDAEDEQGTMSRGDKQQRRMRSRE